MNKIPKFTDNGIEYIDLDTLEQKISSINENRLYHFTSFDNFIKIWLSKSLLFSKRDGMNDIAEKEDIITGNNLAKMMAYLYAVREYKQISLSNAKVIHSNKKGTAIYQSPLMWGIYARNATGICIEFDKEKLLIIGILPLMWFAYFLFELFTGRIKSLYDICLNLSLLFLFLPW